MILSIPVLGYDFEPLAEALVLVIFVFAVLRLTHALVRRVLYWRRLEAGEYIEIGDLDDGNQGGRR